jgi:hypothetical protein
MRRHLKPFTLTAGAFALVGLVLLAFASSASAEALPTIESPGAQASRVGETITVDLTGTKLFSVTGEETLPAGLKLNKVTEEHWTITGVPTTPQTATTVTLPAANKLGEAAVSPATFQWAVKEAVPTIEQPADQTSTVGTSIAAVVIRGTDLASLIPTGLPAGLKLDPSATNPETEWEITGAPTTAKAAATVTLEAFNKEETPVTTATFEWTVSEATTPAAPLVTSTPTPEVSQLAPAPQAPSIKITSAGRLGTVPIQKPGKSLTASFLCEVVACRVVLTATVTAGKSKFKIHSSPTSIKQGLKAKIVLKLSKKQQASIATTLKKHGKVSAAVVASIESTVGLQTTKSLAIAVRR